MPKDLHEIRDPIHNFIRIETEERRILDSRPFQRHRHIHQLAMTHLVYPGATYKRTDSPVRLMDGCVVSSLDASTVLPTIPVVMAEFVFVSDERRKEAESWLRTEIASIIKPQQEDNS